MVVAPIDVWPRDLEVLRRLEDLAEAVLQICEQVHGVDIVDDRQLDAHACDLESGIHDVFEVVGPRALEEEELLGNEGSIIGDPVEVGVVGIECLVDLLQDLDDRYGGAADLPLSVSKGL